MKRKTIQAILSSALLLALLAGCGPGRGASLNGFWYQNGTQSVWLEISGDHCTVWGDWNGEAFAMDEGPLTHGSTTVMRAGGEDLPGIPYLDFESETGSVLNDCTYHFIEGVPALFAYAQGDYIAYVREDVLDTEEAESALFMAALMSGIRSTAPDEEDIRWLLDFNPYDFELLQRKRLEDGSHELISSEYGSWSADPDGTVQMVFDSGRTEALTIHDPRGPIELSEMGLQFDAP